MSKISGPDASTSNLVEMTDASTNGSAGLKKKHVSVLVDPDRPDEELGSSKRPKIDLNEDQKVKVLKAIINSFAEILKKLEIWDLEHLRDITLVTLQLNVMSRKCSPTKG